MSSVILSLKQAPCAPVEFFSQCFLVESPPLVAFLRAQGQRNLSVGAPLHRSQKIRLCLCVNAAQFVFVLSDNPLRIEA